MICILSGLLTVIGMVGAGAFLLHLRRVIDMLPVSIPLACLGLGVLITMAVVGISRITVTGLLRKRGTVSVVIVCVGGAIAVAVAGALLQMGVSLAVASSLQADHFEYERIGVASTRLLTPSFFVVLHGVMCFSFGYSGLRRQSRPMLLVGLLLSMPTLYLLVSYANAPL